MGTPLALGIHWAHDASASICSPDGVLFSIQEERITRLKHYYGFPCRAIEAALKYCNITAKDLSLIAISARTVFYPEQGNYYVVEADGTVSARPQRSQGWRAWVRENILDEFGWAKNQEAQPNAPAEEVIAATWGEFANRHYYLQRQFLTQLGLLDPRIPIYYIAHHRAHAASAFRLSGLDSACVITLDGKGDGLSGTIYRGRPDGQLELVRSSKAADSLGSFYQAVTEALGFVPVDGEHKTMGLAAYGVENRDGNQFKDLVRVEDGVLKSKISWTFRSYNEHNPQKRVPNPLSSVAQTEDFKNILAKTSREQFSRDAQTLCEDVMLAYARDAMALTGSRNLVAAGGVMLNVKANALIRDQLKPSSFFVFPDSADSGLSAGAAMEGLYQAGKLKKNAAFKLPYLGTEYSDAEVEAEIQGFGARYELSVSQADPQQIADSLIAGKVIGTFHGRLEMGPRALGNRSVLADPRSEKMKDRINLILKGREWFVPFAPIVLEEDVPQYWNGSRDYRYMTFSVNASEYARSTVPAVVHVDGSMRPQVVSPDYNKWLYAVLKAFKERTGVGVLLNTSFNRHGLPIVGAPADALEHLVNGWVDGLSMGPWYIEMARNKAE